MSLQSRLEALASAIGADIKAIKTQIAALPAPSADPWSYSVLGSTITSTVTAAADAITGPSLAANTRLVVECKLHVASAAATTGVQVGLAGPSTGVTRSSVKVVSAQTASTDMISHQTLNNWQSSAAGLLTPSLITIDGMIEVGATPGAGTVRVSWRTEVAASTVTMYPGSFMRWRTI